MGLQDSPLSTTSNVAGILTFVVAIAAAAYVRITYMRHADKEFFQVKSSLTWFKTESTWMYDLVNSAGSRKRMDSSGLDKEFQMYLFVMDQIGKLEERLLSLLSQAEDEANLQPKSNRSGTWTVVPQKYKTWAWAPAGTTTAVSWLSIRTKALELVRQRDALGSRVQFAQLSMISSRVIDQELRASELQDQLQDRLGRLEKLVLLQNQKIDRLEDLVQQLANRPRDAPATPDPAR